MAAKLRGSAAEAVGLPSGDGVFLFENKPIFSLSF
jgi:hypothetical protein